MSRVRANTVTNFAGTGTPSLPYGIQVGTGATVSGGTNTISVLTNGSERLSVNSSGVKQVKNGNLNIQSTYIDFSGDQSSTPQTAVALYRPADGTFAISTQNIERLRVTSDGNVCIGGHSTNYADSLLEVRDTNAGGDVAIRVTNDTTTDGSKSGIIFTNSTSDFTAAGIAHLRNANALIFYNGQSNSGGGFDNATEVARFNSLGSLTINVGFDTSNANGFGVGNIINSTAGARAGKIQVQSDGANGSYVPLFEVYNGTERTAYFKADGNLVIGKSGSGIDFSATGNGSGTMTSELLDDYEEGSWTPTLGSGGSAISIDSSDCKYVKVGTLVSCYFEIGAITSPVASSMVMGGLPYSPNNEGGFPMSISNANFGSGYTYLSGHFQSNGDWGIFKSGSGQPWVRMLGTEYSSASWFGTIVYRATS